MRQLDLDASNAVFTRGWFRTRNLATFREFIYPEFAGKPIKYLELGVFEGMSMLWMMQRVLTHPDSRAIGIDPWLCTEKINENEMTAVMMRAFHNVGLDRADLATVRCNLIRGNSAELLRKAANRGGIDWLKKGTVDLSMVDGNHNALAVWDDARYVYKLLKPGGLMLFDDVENDLPKKDHVKEGVGLWLAEAGDTVKLEWKHKYMEAYRKVGQ